MRYLRTFLFHVSLLLCFFFIFQARIHAGVTLPWSTTFNCQNWNMYGDSLSCDGLEKAGGWYCNTGGTTIYEQIISDANYPGGNGGNGQRHWLGDGHNIGSGGLFVTFNTGQTEIWMRWYMRFQTNFQWSASNNGYKVIYLRDQSLQALNYFLIVYPGLDGVDYYTQVGSLKHYYSLSGGYQTLWGTQSNGSWHCFEIHIKSETGVGTNDGIVQMWIDGNLRIDFSNVDHGLKSNNKSIGAVLIGSNADSPNNGQCMYVDYDEIKISNTGYIGPISQSLGSSSTSTTTSLPAPINLKIVTPQP